MSAVTFQALKERLKAEKAQKLVTSPSSSSASVSSSTASSTVGGDRTVIPDKLTDTNSSSSSSSSSSSPSLPVTLRSSLSLSYINDHYTIGSIPIVRYIPEICSTLMEHTLIQYIDSYPERWINLRRRRLQQYGGKPTPQGLLDPEPLPLFLEQCIDELMKMEIFPSSAVRPNHVLINEYLPGQGIFPHTDGPSYYPLVATLSIGGDVIMRYQPRGSSTPIAAEVVLQARSLVITSDEAYTNYMHSIDEVDTEIIGGTGAPCINLPLLSPKNASVPTEYYRENDTLLRSPRRISLTIRHVPSPPPGPVPPNEEHHGSTE